MAFQFTYLIFPYLVSAAVTVGLAAYIVYYGRKNEFDVLSHSLLTILVGVSLWTVSRSVQYLFTNPEWKFIAISFAFTGYSVAALGGLFFGLAFSGRSDVLSPRNVVLISIIPTVGITIIFTQPFHGLAWEVQLVTYNGATFLERSLNPLYFIFWTYGLTAIVIGLILIIQEAVRSAELYRDQVITIFIGIFSPLILGIMYLLDSYPGLPGFVDLTPIGFAITGISFAYAIFRHQLFDVVPVARETIINSMDTGVLVLDIDGTIVDANPIVQKLFDLEEEPVGNHVSTWLSDYPTVSEAIHQVVEQPMPESDGGVATASHTAQNEDSGPDTARLDSSRETDYPNSPKEVNVDGRYFSIEATPVTDRRDRRAGTLIQISDITERYRREQELTRYTELVQTVGDPMYVMDEEGYFQRVNDAFLSYVGFERENVIGSHGTEFMLQSDYEHGTETLFGLLDDEDQRWDTFEMTILAADDEEVLTEAKVTPIRDEDGSLSGSVGALRDIRERKRREEEVELLNDVYDRILRHNIRNDLMVIDSHAELLPDESELQDIADAILSKTGSLHRTADTARQIGKIIHEYDENVEFETVTLCRDAITAMQNEFPDASITGEFHVDAAPVEVHEGLSLAIENLIENGIIHNEGEAEVTVSVDQRGDSIRIEVTDNGPGIPEGEIAVLEETEETDLRHGSGAGLWLVNWIVRKSDGELDFSRHDGRSTVVLAFATVEET